MRGIDESQWYLIKIIYVSKYLMNMSKICPKKILDERGLGI